VVEIKFMTVPPKAFSSHANPNMEHWRLLNAGYRFTQTKPRLSFLIIDPIGCGYADVRNLCDSGFAVSHYRESYHMTDVVGTLQQLLKTVVRCRSWRQVLLVGAAVRGPRGTRSSLCVASSFLGLSSGSQCGMANPAGSSNSVANAATWWRIF
jgi:hypothetical protein